MSISQSLLLKRIVEMASILVVFLSACYTTWTGTQQLDNQVVV